MWGGSDDQQRVLAWNDFQPFTPIFFAIVSFVRDTHTTKPAMLTGAAEKTLVKY